MSMTPPQQPIDWNLKGKRIAVPEMRELEVFSGLLGFASLAVLALVGLSVIKQRWRTTWGAVGVAGARI